MNTLLKTIFGFIVCLLAVQEVLLTSAAASYGISLPPDSQSLLLTAGRLADAPENLIGRIWSPLRSPAPRDEATEDVSPIAGTKTAGLPRIKSLFVENRGQMDEQVRYSVRLPGGIVYLARDEIVFNVLKPVRRNEDRGLHALNGPPGPGAMTDGYESHVVRMRLQDANTKPEIRPTLKQEGVVNYFIGNDPAKWIRDIPTYGEVLYAGIYDGIDLRFYLDNGKLEYDFIVRPGADPRVIAIAMEGVDGIETDQAGNLTLTLQGGDVKLLRPVVYQEKMGKKAAVDGAYLLREDRTIAFQVSGYNPSAPLIIDPVVLFSTLLGGEENDLHPESSDTASGIAPGDCGGLYIVGTTSSPDFPTKSATNTGVSMPQIVVFVTSIDPKTRNLLFTTYLGGAFENRGTAIDCRYDVGGTELVVTGTTRSQDFPVTQGAFQKSNTATENAFVALLNGSGDLRASSYFGCTNTVGSAISALRASEDIAITGSMWISASYNCLYFATNLGNQHAFQMFPPGPSGDHDAFVSVLTIKDTGLVTPHYISFLGGSSWDEGLGVAFDYNGSVVVVGRTVSQDFPHVAPSTEIQKSHAGGWDAFITKFNYWGTGLIFSTFLGGSSDDQANAVAIAPPFGNIVVAGTTESPDFPVTQFAMKKNLQGQSDAFVTAITADGRSLVFSTYFGGELNDSATAVITPYTGDVYIAGETDSSSFPTTEIQIVRKPQNSFVARIDSWNGNTLVFSRLLGGTGDDFARGVTLVDDAVWVTGQTTSKDFITGTLKGTYDAFLVAIADYIAMPARQEIYQQPPAYYPNRRIDLHSARPIGTGPVAQGGDALRLAISIEKFPAPVDIYLAMSHGTDLYVVLPDNAIQSINAGLVPWKSAVKGPVLEELYSEIPLSLLPPGQYAFYLAVTPAGSVEMFYIWTTGFSMP